MFKVTALAFSLFAFSASAARRLDYSKYASYEPDSSVTDHAALDLDQASMEAALAIGTADSFEIAKAIYQQGGHSKSYAIVTLTPPLASAITKGTVITGVTATGTPVNGKAYADFESGDTVISIQYQTSDVQESYVNCQVGALTMAGEQNLSGCFAAQGEINIVGAGTHGYTYNPEDDNNNGRTLAGFSLQAEDKMYSGCPGCPYDDYLKFFNYYGQHDYAHEWVMAALDGRQTTFTNGNADFSEYGFTGRTEAVKKGTAYMHVWMYVIRELYDAIDDCQSGCTDCNDDPVHAWDEGAAFYVGSTESKMPYTLGQKRCENYKTCGANGDEIEGQAKVNFDIMAEFSMGQMNLNQGNCEDVRTNAANIARLMAVPLVQGTMRYAYKVNFLQGEEKEAAEGAVFAAAVLPILHECDANAATTVYENMRVGATSTDYMAVRRAFEDHYGCMGLTCQDIGGLYNPGLGEYYPDASPCGSGITESDAEREEATDSAANQYQFALAAAVGVVMAFVAM